MRALLVPVTLALLTAGLVAPPAGASPDPDRGAARATTLASTGYVLGSASDPLVARDAHGLATLGVDGVTLARNGGSVDGAGRRRDPACSAPRTRTGCAPSCC